MKILIMGSIPTYERDEIRELSPQEEPFVSACKDLGFAATSQGHSVLLADDHPCSADLYVMQGVQRFASSNPDKQVDIYTHRAAGSEMIFDTVPSNLKIHRQFHPDFDKQGTGTLIPNLGALQACDVMILIGGKLTVKLMGNIAADRDKGIVAIPSFGGTSLELFDKLKYLYKNALKDRFEDLSVLQSVWLEDSADKIIDLAEVFAGEESEAPPHSYFISYTWDDSPITDHVEVLLRRNRRAVNRDESIFRAGADLSDVVKSLICESDTFIGLWGEKFKNSTWCPHELEYALDKKTKGLKPSRIVLLVLDDTEPPIRFTGNLRLNGKDRDKRDLSIRRLIEEE